MSIDTFNETIRGCRLCRLCETRTHAVCGEGNPRSGLMFVAQAPGSVEDREGRMFLGPSGQGFFDLLAPAGIGRGDFYMTNLLKCKLPNNRKPNRDEIITCARYLNAEIRWARPRVIVPLGYYATRYLFEKYVLPWPPSREGGELFGTVYDTGECLVYPLRHAL